MEIVSVLLDSDLRGNDVSKYAHQIVRITDLANAYVSQSTIEMSMATADQEVHAPHLVKEIVQVYVSVMMDTSSTPMKIVKWLVFVVKRVSIGIPQLLNVFLFVL